MTRRQKDPLRPLTEEERKLLIHIGRSHAEPASHVGRSPWSYPRSQPTPPGRSAVYKKYFVRLTDEERAGLEALVRIGKAHARSLLYARILLKADASEGGPAWTDERIAEALETSADTVARERRRFVEDGLEVALIAKKPGRPRRRALDDRAEAHLVALASCSEPPEGRAGWTLLRLLAERMVELGYVDGASRETVRRTLKKRTAPPLGQGVGDPTPRERSVRVAHGGGLGPLRGALR